MGSAAVQRRHMVLPFPCPTPAPQLLALCSRVPETGVASCARPLMVTAFSPGVGTWRQRPRRAGVAGRWQQVAAGLLL